MLSPDQSIPVRPIQRRQAKMISYRMNTRRAPLAKATCDPHRSLTSELAELNHLREQVRLAETRIQKRKYSLLFAAGRRAQLL
jgi:hypothetical protein